MSLIHALHEDTLIEVNGILTPIKDIQIGDVVKSYNTDSQVIGESKVVSKHIGFDSEYLHIILSDGSELKTSIKSLFYSQNGEWVSPLEAYTDEITLHNELTITSLKLVEGDISIVSIEVEPDHNYYVGNLLVHNTGPTGPQGPRGYQGSSPTGPQGYQGSSPQGPQGYQGSSPQGYQGYQGNAGSSPQGYQGYQGNAGSSPQGPQGNTGNQGYQGSSPQGPQGNTGAQGYQGSSPQGPRGPCGEEP